MKKWVAKLPRKAACVARMAVLSNAFTIGVGSSTVRMETAHENYAVAGIEHCLPLGLPHSCN